MATVGSSALKGLSGRIGDQIFYVVDGKTFVRQAPDRIAYSRTPAQHLQRWRQNCVQTMFRSVKGTLLQKAAGEAARLSGTPSGYHLFLSRNMNAFGLDDYIDYSKLCFGGMGLQLPDDLRLVVTEGRQLHFTWKKGVEVSTASLTDSLVVAAIFPDEPYRLELVGVSGVTRGQCGAELSFGAVEGDIQLYCFFMNREMTSFSPDRYFKVSDLTF